MYCQVWQVKLPNSVCSELNYNARQAKVKDSLFTCNNKTNSTKVQNHNRVDNTVQGQCWQTHIAEGTMIERSEKEYPRVGTQQAIRIWGDKAKYGGQTCKPGSEQKYQVQENAGKTELESREQSGSFPVGGKLLISG